MYAFIVTVQLVAVLVVQLPPVGKAHVAVVPAGAVRVTAVPGAYSRPTKFPVLTLIPAGLEVTVPEAPTTLTDSWFEVREVVRKAGESVRLLVSVKTHLGLPFAQPATPKSA